MLTGAVLTVNGVGGYINPLSVEGCCSECVVIDLDLLLLCAFDLLLFCVFKLLLFCVCLLFLLVAVNFGLCWQWWR